MKTDREQELKTRLAMQQKLTLSEAMELLGISESTARRMFSRLESEGIAIRTHGGIQNVGNALTVYSFETGAKTNIEQKSAIAREACRLLEDGDVIFCDSGTTVQCFCAEMVNYVPANDIRVQVYTNSLAVLELLSPLMSVTLVGGTYRPNRKDFCGYLTEQALQGVYFSKCFVGTDGCRNCAEFTTTDFETARMNEIAIRNSDSSYVLADSSKFTKGAHVVFALASQLSAVVTDSGLSHEFLERIRNHCPQTILA